MSACFGSSPRTLNRGRGASSSASCGEARPARIRRADPMIARSRGCFRRRRFSMELRLTPLFLNRAAPHRAAPKGIAVFCQKCGKQIPDGAVFCNFCGGQQGVVAQAPPAPGYPQQAPPPGVPPQPPGVPQHPAAYAPAGSKDLKCSSCGAPLTPQGGLTLITCDYCGTATSLGTAGWSVIQKHFMLDNRIDQQVALETGGKWLDQGILRRNVAKNAELLEATLRYVPYWIVPTSVTADIQGLKGTGQVNLGGGQSAGHTAASRPSTGTSRSRRRTSSPRASPRSTRRRRPGSASTPSNRSCRTSSSPRGSSSTHPCGSSATITRRRRRCTS